MVRNYTKDSRLSPQLYRCQSCWQSFGSAKPTVDCWFSGSNKTSTRACHGFNSRERQTVVIAHGFESRDDQGYSPGSHSPTSRDSTECPNDSHPPSPRAAADRVAVGHVALAVMAVLSRCRRAVVEFAAVAPALRSPPPAAQPPHRCHVAGTPTLSGHPVSRRRAAVTLVAAARSLPPTPRSQTRPVPAAVVVSPPRSPQCARPRQASRPRRSA